MRLHSLALSLVIGCLLCASGLMATANAAEPGIPDGYKLLYSQDFENEAAIKDFEFTDPSKWKLTEKDGNRVLEFTSTNEYKPKVRSPRTIGLVSDKVFGDFVLEVNVLQTGREYGHRDTCLFFGFTDPSKFYYAHIASKADPNAHNIFIVNDAPRTNIAKKTTAGIEWGQGKWHKVRLVRTVADGKIELFFDDMTEPLMIAEDKTFGPGYVGFGTFDDSGMVDNIKIWGPKAESKPSSFFEKSGGPGGQ